MPNHITYNIEYREFGRMHHIPVTISFIANDCIEMYSDLMAYSLTIKKKWDEITALQKEIGDIEIKKEEGWETLLAQKQEKITQVAQDMADGRGEVYMDKRFALVKQILEDNAVTDERLLTRSFWMRHTDAQEMINFLTAAMRKDIDGKKKQ